MLGWISVAFAREGRVRSDLILCSTRYLVSLISFFLPVSLTFSLWHLVSLPPLFSVCPSLILCCFIFLVVCSLTHFLRDPAYACLTGYLSFSLTHSFAPFLSQLSHLCLFAYYKHDNPQGYHSFCFAEVQSPFLLFFVSVPFLIYARRICLSLSPSISLLSHFLSLFLIVLTIYSPSLIFWDSGFCFCFPLFLSLWLNHWAIHLSFKSLSFRVRTEKVHPLLF